MDTTSRYTEKEALHIKTYFAYFVSLSIIMFIAIGFQISSGMTFGEYFPTLVLAIITAFISFIIYWKIRNRKKATFLMYLVSFMTVIAPFLAKFKYASTFGWTFSLTSYNSSALLLMLMFATALFLDEKLFVIISIFSITAWILFIYIAIANGAEYSNDSIVNGEIYTGVIIFREYFFILMGATMSFMAFRWIRIINSFAVQTGKQKEEIQLHITQMRNMNLEVKNRVDNLLKEVETQDQLVVRFNEKMQSQAATFEEISATLEELRGSAESIHNSTMDQIDGNMRMDEIIDDFKNIKIETKANLNSTYDGIKGISDRTTEANDKMIEVEETMNTIARQSEKIAATITIIVDIADRINLLSLNASIEAARAGEHGKGFAVVADEVGKLAFQTTESIKEIDKVLALNNDVTGKGVLVIKDSSTMIKNMIGKMSGSTENIKILQDSLMVEEKYINSIIRQMEANISLSKTIGTGTDEQKNAIESTGNALENLNDIVNEMVREINELAQSSKNIMDNARDLLKQAEEII
ncbi:MAG: methyl-accepting chemotaxis protein [Spirochaetota bacterium]